MTVKQGTPQVVVTIYVDDQKYQIKSSLGDYNSDILSVTTNKSMSSPSGTFSITFVPKLDMYSRTWFNKLDAFDYVEIAFQGMDDPKSKVVMRGLIDSVNKGENWTGGSGEPKRSIVINGRDLGSLLENHSIYYIPELGKRQAMESYLKVLTWKKFFPFEVNAWEAFDFIGDRFRECVDVDFNGVPVRQKLGFAADAMFTDDRTNLLHLMGYEGPFWNAFSQYQDKPFHEIFVYDADDMAYLVLRPSRLKDAMGDYHKSVGSVGKYEYTIPDRTKEYVDADPLMATEIASAEEKRKEVQRHPVIMYPPAIEFTTVDKIDVSVSKSHNEVFNYYLTTPALMLLGKIEFQGICLETLEGKVEESENPFFQINKTLPAYIGKYGFRKLEANTYFINLDVGQLGVDSNGRPTRGKDYVAKVLAPSFLQKGIQRNRTMVAWFLHNQYLLSGSITIRGTNGAIIGTYVTDLDENMEYYIENVSHSFVLFDTFTTTLGVTRGQPPKESNGLVGLSKIDARYNYETLNKYYFNGSGTRSVYREVYLKPLEETKSTPGKKTSKSQPNAAARAMMPGWKETEQGKTYGHWKREGKLKDISKEQQESINRRGS